MVNDAFSSFVNRKMEAEEAATGLVQSESKPSMTSQSRLSSVLPPCPTPPYELTEQELSQYTDPKLPHPSPKFAHCPRPLLLALNSIIFDVTAGEKFYGPGSAYSLFAGKRCGRALTLGSLDDADMSDDFSGFSEKELAAVDKQVKFYQDKYKEVGRVVGEKK